MVRYDSRSTNTQNEYDVVFFRLIWIYVAGDLFRRWSIRTNDINIVSR